MVEHLFSCVLHRHPERKVIILSGKTDHKTNFFDSPKQNKPAAALTALQGCTLALRCFELNANVMLAGTVS